MKSSTRQFLAAVAALCAVGAAQAQQSPLYVGASAGASRLDFDFTGQVRALSTGILPVTRASLTDKEGSAYKLTLGYQALPWLGLELDYVDLGEFSNSYEFNGLGRYTRQGRYELDGFNVSAVMTHKIDDRFSLHGRVGAFRSTYKYSETGENFPAFQPSTEPPTHRFVAPDLKATSFSFGVGGMYSVNKNLSVRLEWDRYARIGNPVDNNENSNGKFDAVDLFTVGVVWRF
ncbi:MAG: outer membrane beta-barrel protein [Betaproteobacteria bacterium]|nr:outer membrane beta-barrel protein [Betaproteobacteria bacterium]